MSVNLLEKDIQKQILEYLKIKGIFHWRNNTGAAKYGNHFVRFGVPGAPDIFVLRNGMLWCLEVKRPGGKLSENQEMFKVQTEANGGKYVMLTSLDEVMQIL